MSDSPNQLKAQLLSECSTEEQRQFAQVLAQQCAMEDLRKSGHRCEYHIPTNVELDRIRKYNEPDADVCPTCKAAGKYGRLYLWQQKWNLGPSLHIICSNKDLGCDFTEDITDVDAWW